MERYEERKEDYFAEAHQEPVTVEEALPRNPEAETPAEEPPAYTFTDVRKAFSAKAYDVYIQQR